MINEELTVINSEVFAARLKMQRELAGYIKPRNLALAMCGLSPNETELSDTEQHRVATKIQNIRNWERGDNFPSSIQEFARLCKLIDCDPDYLLYEECKTPRKAVQTAMELTGLSDDVVNRLLTLKQTDISRLDGLEDSTAYYNAVRSHLFIPTFNALVGHPQFTVFISQLTQFLIDREAPKNAGGPIDPREYAEGKRTISAELASELMFTIATQTLRQILTKPWGEWSKFERQEIMEMLAEYNNEKP